VEARHHLRRRLRPIVATAILVAPLGAAGAFAAASMTVLVPDAAKDVSGALDLQRASLKLASDGRLRFVVTLAARVDAKAMLGGSGPPGSVCVKVWTDPDADPAATRADHLVCVTASNKDDLRASVYAQTAPGLPRLLGPAAVALNASRRSIVLRVSQSSLGRPQLISFAVESTRPGCARVSCIDQAPDDGAVRRFRLRAAA
jgi:hypothetical protein